jgi:hypothetical protein
VFSYLAVFFIGKKYRKTKFALSVLAGVFYILQFISLVMIAHDMNYAFLANLFDLTNYVAALSVYRKYSALLLLLSIVISYALYKINSRFHVENRYLRGAMLLMSFTYLLSPPSFVARFAKVCYEMVHNPSSKMNHSELFREITGLDYVNREDIRVKLPARPKNLVIIALESFEQKLLEEFGHMTENVNSYARDGEFYSDITMIEGSGWTIAGIHTFLCGSPMIYNLSEHSLLKSVSISKLVCLPDVLNRAGYYQMYIGGEKRKFSGKSQFLFSHSYNEVLGKKELHREYHDLDVNNLSNWGFKDREVFKIAKDKYRKLIESKRPFSLMISTLDTHGPDRGILDSRCKNPTGNGMLDSVECTDGLLADFIEFIRKEPNYEDTLIVILPDHLAMGHFSDMGAKGVGETDRKLYVILLNSAGPKGRRPAGILYTDVASLILERLGIEHNARFLLENRGNQSQRERVEYINKNLEKIRSFNNKTLLHE